VSGCPIGPSTWEQIGSVYETVMGFTVLALSGQARSDPRARGQQEPIAPRLFVDLTALAAKRERADRLRFLKEEAESRPDSRHASPPRSALPPIRRAWPEALRPIVDERGSPGGQPAVPGAPLLQPTDERRRSGKSLYSRSLTEPIVRYALEPAFAGLAQMRHRNRCWR